ncbi:hypothetical protein D3C71_2179320 [compost metagenome]
MDELCHGRQKSFMPLYPAQAEKVSNLTTEYRHGNSGRKANRYWLGNKLDQCPQPEYTH